MTLQSSGAISLANLASEYTDSAPNSLSEFYRNGGKVPNSITTNVPAGSYVTQYNQSTYYWRVGLFSEIRWNNVTINQGALTSSTATTYSAGGFDYQRGSFVGNVTTGSGKTAFTWAYYQVRRRTSATTSTQNVNQNVPTSGTISLSQFYGGRAT